MAAIEAALSIFSVYLSSSSKFLSYPKSSPSIKLHNSNSVPTLSHNFSPSPFPHLHNNPTRNLWFEVCSVMQEVVEEEEEEEEEKPEQTLEPNQKRKLYVFNFPLPFSVVDFKNLFGQCGTVADVEIIKQKDGRTRGFAFVTMTTAEEAQAAIDKFDSYELSDRIIRVDFAKRFKKPSPPPPEGLPARETRQRLYASNLAWKVRSTHLREFFSENFKPVSARVVFDGPLGRSAGYGFLSFATKEEAEAATSALDGKELMGRPICLQFSQTNVDKSGSKKEEEEEITEGQVEES